MPESFENYQRRMGLEAGFGMIKNLIDALNELIVALVNNGKSIEISDYEIMEEFQEDVDRVTSRVEEGKK